MVQVTYVTDPACPRSWAVEPAIRRVRSQFGDQVQFTWVMAGIVRELGDPVQRAVALLDAGAESGMPVDARGWLVAPPRSSHPACLAVVAAREQGLDGSLLRVLREAFCLRRGRPDSPDALHAAARTVPGLDPVRFGYALASSATVEAFGADFEQARELAGDRATPVLAVDGVPVEVSALGAAVEAAGAIPAVSPTVAEALSAPEPLAAAEVAAVCDLPVVRATAELWRLVLEFRARPEQVGSGRLWHAA